MFYLANFILKFPTFQYQELKLTLFYKIIKELKKKQIILWKIFVLWRKFTRNSWITYRQIIFVWGQKWNVHNYIYLILPIFAWYLVFYTTTGSGGYTKQNVQKVKCYFNFYPILGWKVGCKFGFPYTYFIFTR